LFEQFLVLLLGRAELVVEVVFEAFPVDLSDVLVDESHQVSLQAFELTVLFVVVEGNYGDSVLQLVPKGVHRVVDYRDVVDIPTRENPQIFDIDALFCLHAVIPEEAVLDDFLIPIKKVQHLLSVA